MDESRSTELLGSTNNGERAGPCRFFSADWHMVIMRKIGTGRQRKQVSKAALPWPFSPVEDKP